MKVSLLDNATYDLTVLIRVNLPSPGLMYYSPNAYADAGCNVHAEPEFFSFVKDDESIKDDIECETKGINKSPCPDNEEVSIDFPVG